jgi:hypothetical protein
MTTVKPERTPFVPFASACDAMEVQLRNGRLIERKPSAERRLGAPYPIRLRPAA